jgi:hypothetical protein
MIVNGIRAWQENARSKGTGLIQRKRRADNERFGVRINEY